MTDLNAKQQHAVRQATGIKQLLDGKCQEFMGQAILQSQGGMQRARQDCHDVLDSYLDAVDTMGKVAK